MKEMRQSFRLVISHYDKEENRVVQVLGTELCHPFVAGQEDTSLWVVYDLTRERARFPRDALREVRLRQTH